MQPSAAAESCSRQFEALRLFAYPDPMSPLAKATPEFRNRWGYEPAEGLVAKLDDARKRLSPRPWTVGIGTTGESVGIDSKVTEHEAEVLHLHNLSESGRIVSAAVHVPMTQSMFDALCCFVNNVGPGRKATATDYGKDGFVTLKDGRPSTMLRKLNDRDYKGAREQFLTWVYAAGSPTQVAGLRNRRAAEYALFGSVAADFGNVVAGVESTAPEVKP